MQEHGLDYGSYSIHSWETAECTRCFAVHAACICGTVFQVHSPTFLAADELIHQDFARHRAAAQVAQMHAELARLGPASAVEPAWRAAYFASLRGLCHDVHQAVGNAGWDSAERLAQVPLVVKLGRLTVEANKVLIQANAARRVKRSGL